MLDFLTTTLLVSEYLGPLVLILAIFCSVVSRLWTSLCRLVIEKATRRLRCIAIRGKRKRLCRLICGIENDWHIIHSAFESSDLRRLVVDAIRAKFLSHSLM